MADVVVLPVVRIERFGACTEITPDNGTNVAIIAGHDAERRRRLTTKPPKAFAYDGEFGFWPMVPHYGHHDTSPSEYSAPDSDPA